MKMLLKSLTVVSLFLIISCTSNPLTSATKKEERPNILFILCDDLGYSDVGFNGGKDVKTPSLDALAANGTMFTSAYNVHPFCGPSRAGLMTGRYPHLIGAQFNLPRTGMRGYHTKGVPTEEMYISKTLQNTGYYTGAVGKWHLGHATEFHPNNRGFDDFYGFLGGGHNYFPAQYEKAYQKELEKGTPAKDVWNYLTPLEHNGKEVKETEYLTDALSREAVRFVNDAAKKENPFFLYLAYNAPHSPLQAKKEDLAQFPDIKDKKRRTFAAMVYAVDRGVGNIVKALKANGEFENTLIVFLSDNGGKLKLGGTNYPLTAGKGSTHEGGYRTPMFFHYPKKIKKGNQYTYPISTLDFYPTFAYLAGAELPKDKVLDGKNFWNSLEKNKNSREGEMIYALRHREGYSDVGARKDDWKILQVGQKKWQLFNIEEDISEQNDLSAKHPERLKAMVEETKKWSAKHLQPLWFFNDKTDDEWKADGMPHFEKTFKIE